MIMYLMIFTQLYRVSLQKSVWWYHLSPRQIQHCVVQPQQRWYLEDICHVGMCQRILDITVFGGHFDSRCVVKTWKEYMTQFFTVHLPVCNRWNGSVWFDLLCSSELIEYLMGFIMGHWEKCVFMSRCCIVSMRTRERGGYIIASLFSSVFINVFLLSVFF